MKKLSNLDWLSIAYGFLTSLVVVEALCANWHSFTLLLLCDVALFLSVSQRAQKGGKNG